jgi:hypothetical protein
MKKNWDTEIEDLKELAGRFGGIWEDVFSEYEEEIDNIWQKIWESDEYDDMWVTLYEKEDREEGTLFPQLASQLKAITTNLNTAIIKRKKVEAQQAEAAKAKEKKEKEVSKAKGKKLKELARAKENQEERGDSEMENKSGDGESKDNDDNGNDDGGLLTDEGQIDEAKYDEGVQSNSESGLTEITSTNMLSHLTPEEMEREKRTDEEISSHIVKIRQVTDTFLSYVSFSRSSLINVATWSIDIGEEDI